MAGNVGGAEHLATDVAGHFSLMPDHVRAQSVFGGEGRSAGLQTCAEYGHYYLHYTFGSLFKVNSIVTAFA